MLVPVLPSELLVSFEGICNDQLGIKFPDLSDSAKDYS